MPATTNDPLELLTLVVRAERDALALAARAEGATPEDALECVQDALMTMLRAEQAGELPEGLPARTAWLFTAVRNAARNARRRHHRLKPHQGIDEEHPLDAPTAEDLLTHAEDTIRLRACVSELCGVQRAVVTLRLLEERSGEDVATTLGLSRSHVDVLVHRAKAALRVCMRHRDA